MTVARVGLLGCGTVGQGVVRMLAEQGGTIGRGPGRRIEVGPILVRDLDGPARGSTRCSSPPTPTGCWATRT